MISVSAISAHKLTHHTLSFLLTHLSLLFVSPGLQFYFEATINNGK